MITSINLKGLISELDKRHTVIYGAGFIAEKLWRGLEKKCLTDRVDAVVTSSGDGGDFHGIPIQAISDLEYDGQLICIAVHKTALESVQHTLAKYGLEDTFWVYPYLNTILLGEPIELSRKVSTRELISNNLENYEVSVRYLAIKSYLASNPIGADIYKKSMMLHCEESTAINRWNTYCEMIDNWKGFNPKQPIVVMDNLELIDGAHRLALAAHNGDETMTCDIYPARMSSAQYHGAEAVITQNVLDTKYTEAEQRLILEAREELRNISMQ